MPKRKSVAGKRGEADTNGQEAEGKAAIQRVARLIGELVAMAILEERTLKHKKTCRTKK